MSAILEFFANNLIWFVIITVFLLFSLIGYFVDNGINGKKILQKAVVDKPTVINEEEKLEQIKNSIKDEGMSLDNLIKKQQDHPTTEQPLDDVLYETPQIPNVQDTITLNANPQQDQPIIIEQISQSIETKPEPGPIILNSQPTVETLNNEVPTQKQ